MCRPQPTQHKPIQFPFLSFLFHKIRVLFTKYVSLQVSATILKAPSISPRVISSHSRSSISFGHFDSTAKPTPTSTKRRAQLLKHKRHIEKELFWVTLACWTLLQHAQQRRGIGKTAAKRWRGSRFATVHSVHQAIWTNCSHTSTWQFLIVFRRQWTSSATSR